MMLSISTGRRSESTWACILALSGFTALLLEISWLHELSFMLGNSAISTLCVVSVFLFGLGVGNVLGGYLAPLSLNPQRLYAIGEYAIAVCAMLVPGLMRFVHDAVVSAHASTQGLVLRSEERR